MQSPISQRFCRDIILPSDEKLVLDPTLKPHELAQLKAVYVKGKRWPQNSTIAIEFMGGTTEQKNLVEKVVMEAYQPLINLTLKFVTRGTVTRSDIRVSFDPLGGSWSSLGTDCLKIPQDRPTLNLAWLDNPPLSTDNCCYGVIKHEFGHAIAAWLHEHQNPSSDNKLSANWNKPAIYKALSGPPYEWSTETIFVNMFKLYDQNLIRGSVWDPKSIMQYFFPSSWTLNNVGLAGNQQLSKTDTLWLGKEYPLAKKKAASKPPEKVTRETVLLLPKRPQVMFDTLTIVLMVCVFIIATILIIIVSVVVVQGGSKKRQILITSL
jgi:hypothetical protein